MPYDIEQEIKSAEDAILRLREEKIQREIQKLIDERNQINSENEQLKIAYREKLNKEFAEYKDKVQSDYEDLLAQAQKKMDSNLANEKYILGQKELIEQEVVKAQAIRQEAEKEMSALLSLRESELVEIAKLRGEIEAKSKVVNQVAEDNKKLADILNERKHLLDNLEFQVNNKKEEAEKISTEVQAARDEANNKFLEAERMFKLVEDESHVIKNNLAEIKQAKEDNQKILATMDDYKAAKLDVEEKNLELIEEASRLALLREKTLNDARALDDKQRLNAAEDRKRAEQINVLKKLREETNA